jgi:hypothetical protein
LSNVPRGPRQIKTDKPSPTSPTSAGRGSGLVAGASRRHGPTGGLASPSPAPARGHLAAHPRAPTRQLTHRHAPCPIPTPPRLLRARLESSRLYPILSSEGPPSLSLPHRKGRARRHGLIHPASTFATCAPPPSPRPPPSQDREPAVRRARQRVGGGRAMGTLLRPGPAASPISIASSSAHGTAASPLCSGAWLSPAQASVLILSY